MGTGVLAEENVRGALTGCWLAGRRKNAAMIRRLDQRSAWSCGRGGGGCPVAGTGEIRRHGCHGGPLRRARDVDPRAGERLI